MAFRRSRSVKSDSDLTESIMSERYFTVAEAIPVSIPLDKADLGHVCIKTATEDDPEDLMLLYEMNTAELSIQVCKDDSKIRAGTYKINGIQAASLELVNPLVGYLESMLVRLVIETDQDVVYTKRDGEESIADPSIEEKVSTRRIILYASVHECGHLRDILLFMKSKAALSSLSIEKDNPFVNPQKRDEVDLAEDNPPLTYLAPLPWWSIYVPWWLYSGKVRKLLQLGLIMYAVFSIIWASWQLYRHVNLIQIALDPFVQLLKLYLQDVMTLIDHFLTWFTELSTTFLRPLHIFSGLFLVPLVNILLVFKNALIPLVVPVFSFAGRFFTPLSKCFTGVWQSLKASRVALQNIDLTHQVAKNLLISSFKAIFQGLLRFVGYSRAKSKEQKAMQARAAEMKSPSSDSIPPQPSGTPRRRYTGVAPNASIPVFYNSPVAKGST